MLTMGRRRTPTILKELADNPGKRPLNKNEPRPLGAPVMPKDMSKEAAAIWKRLITFMPAGVWTPLEADLLAAYCNAAATEQEATRELNTSPKVVRGSSGNMVPSPWLKIRADSARLMVQLTVKLGLDPASRSLLQQPSDEDDDDGFDIH
jgi:P27 family predicted phage terminase small subunit